MALIKLYHQNEKTFGKVFIAEKYVINAEDFREWMQIMWKENPPPEGYRWLAVEPHKEDK